MRILAIARLSRESSASLSIDDQRRRIGGWADANDHEIVGWATDDGVSGTVAPWNRPGTAEWFPSTLGNRSASKSAASAALAASRADEYDGIAFAAVDRLGRNMLDALTIIDWLKATGRSAWDLASGLDVAAPGMGAVVLGVMSGLAQAEREKMQGRARDSRRRLARAGRYAGGMVPLGYRQGIDDDGHPRLVIDPEGSALVQDVARRIIAGESINAIVADLNARGLTTQNGKMFRVGSLTKTMKSDRLLGFQVSEDKESRGEFLVRDELGNPVQRAEPVLTPEVLREVRARLASNNRARGHKPGDKRVQALLLRVLYCGECLNEHGTDVPMYRYTGSRGTIYYRCGSRSVGGAQSCSNLSIPAAAVDQFVVDGIVGEYGDEPVIERVWTPGTDADEEIAAIDARLANMREDRDAGMYTTQRDLEEFRARYRTLSEQREKLGANGRRPSGWRTVPTGTTVRERWYQAPDDAARNELLRNSGLKIVVTRGTGKRGQGPETRLFRATEARANTSTARERQEVIHLVTSAYNEARARVGRVLTTEG